jgi:hypothetical protein
MGEMRRSVAKISVKTRDIVGRASRSKGWTNTPTINPALR